MSAIGLLLVLLGIACGKENGPQNSGTRVEVLRVGVGGLPSQTPERGVRQFVSNISLEGLVRVDQTGRARTALAESLAISPDALSITLRLRPNVTFHDGSPLSADAVASILRAGLAQALGPAYEDVDSIAASGADAVQIRLRHPSPFVTESLDLPIQKIGAPGIGTAPFIFFPDRTSPNAPGSMRAYDQYYLGTPSVSRISITTYPDIRAAWADLLRDRLDMLYEVGIDALDSMAGSSRVSVYTFDRPYQYVVFLNSHSPKLRSPAIRRALNQAVDRTAIVHDALAGHGTPSSGPVSPHHWAFNATDAAFDYNPAAAAAAIKTSQEGRLTLRCLTPSEPPYERLALMLKQGLYTVGVDLVVEEIKPDNIIPTLAKRDFEAVLVDAASGWSLFRAYRWWHSKGTQNVAGFASTSVDDALDRVRHSANDDDYRAGAAAFQKAIAEDPPAIFLAWGDRSRAVTRRFDVQAEPGRDVLSTLRLWKPANGAARASRN